MFSGCSNVESVETLSLSRLVATWTMAALLTTGIMLGAGASTVRGDEMYEQPGLGSTEEYMNRTPDFPDSYEVPLLGIEVINGVGSLKGGHPFSGVEIIRAFPSSPVAAAGLQGRSDKVQTVITLGLMAGSMFFPPAMFGVMALQQSGIGQSHQLIIAVDGQRTRDLFDLGQALQETKAGEIVYLTVVSGGRRAQVRVALPPIGADTNSGSF
jgi:S1-C subfamily serine protease